MQEGKGSAFRIASLSSHCRLGSSGTAVLRCIGLATATAEGLYQVIAVDDASGPSAFAIALSCGCGASALAERVPKPPAPGGDVPIREESETRTPIAALTVPFPKH